MATKQEVKNRALEELGVKTIGQGAHNKDDTRIGTAYTEVYADLKKEGLAVWAEAGTIPDDVAPHLVNLMALNAINTYKVSPALFGRLTHGTNSVMQGISISKREIRPLTVPDHESLDEPKNF